MKKILIFLSFFLLVGQKSIQSANNPTLIFEGTNLLPSIQPFILEAGNEENTIKEKLKKHTQLIPIYCKIKEKGQPWNKGHFFYFFHCLMIRQKQLIRLSVFIQLF